MALELRKHSKYWYGRYVVGGERVSVALDVEVRGKRPTTPGGSGSAEFENSRGEARRALQAHIREARSKKAAVRHLEQIYEIKTGEQIGTVPLDEMAARWKKAAGRRDRSPKYVTGMEQLLKRFTDFVAERHPKAQSMSQVTPVIARSFMDAQTATGITGRTYNSILIMLRSVFRKLGPDAGIPLNPFQNIPSRPMNTLHREPFSMAQLEGVLKVAHPMVRPILVAGLCTAMRKGDCCLLRWADVDLAQGFIRVKTSKTGETAEIPILPLLRTELEHRPRGGEYVFPEVAELYQRNPYGVTALTKQAFVDAGVQTNAERKDGRNSGSVHDFHSLRTTWITNALAAGVPMELVRRVTGHQTVDVVLKHYFRPGREEFRRTLQTAMPKLLTRGGKSPKEQVLDICRKTSGKTWKKDARRVAEIVAGM